MKKNYSLGACEDLMRKYWNKGGHCVVIEEGCLGLGTVVCFAKGYKTAIIQEYYINSQTSGHTVMMYNKMPKKYIRMIEKLGLL